MDHKTLELLEYKKIQELLAGQAGTPMGRSLARNAFPVNASLARDRQKVGREIAGALLKVSSPSIAEVPDVRTKVSGVMPVSYTHLDDEYQDASMAYWTDDGKIMGIPSYVHWLCLASKLPESEEFKDRAGYFLASPGFLDSGLSGLDGGWAVQNVLDYVEWVGSNFGRYVEEPLDRWAQNQSVALFPVCLLYTSRCV